MMRRALVLLLLAGQAQAAMVRVRIAGVRNDRGEVLLAICPRATFLQPHCPWQGHIPAHKDSVQIDVAGVPPGTYAAQAFHDENNNGILDRSLLGFPKEGIGFSNDAPMRYGPPRFDAASFTLGQQDAQISVLLRYFN